MSVEEMRRSEGGGRGTELSAEGLLLVVNARLVKSHEDHFSSHILRFKRPLQVRQLRVPRSNPLIHPLLNQCDLSNTDNNFELSVWMEFEGSEEYQLIFNQNVATEKTVQDILVPVWETRACRNVVIRGTFTVLPFVVYTQETGDSSHLDEQGHPRISSSIFINKSSLIDHMSLTSELASLLWTSPPNAVVEEAKEEGGFREGRIRGLTTIVSSPSVSNISPSLLLSKQNDELGDLEDSQLLLLKLEDQLSGLQALIGLDREIALESSRIYMDSISDCVLTLTEYVSKIGHRNRDAWNFESRNEELTNLPPFLLECVYVLLKGRVSWYAEQSSALSIVASCLESQTLRKAMDEQGLFRRMLRNGLESGRLSEKIGGVFFGTLRTMLFFREGREGLLEEGKTIQREGRRGLELIHVQDDMGPSVNQKRESLKDGRDRPTGETKDEKPVTLVQCFLGMLLDCEHWTRFTHLRSIYRVLSLCEKLSDYRQSLTKALDSDKGQLTQRVNGLLAFRLQEIVEGLTSVALDEDDWAEREDTSILNRYTSSEMIKGVRRSVTGRRGVITRQLGLLLIDQQLIPSLAVHVGLVSDFGNGHEVQSLLAVFLDSKGGIPFLCSQWSVLQDIQPHLSEGQRLTLHQISKTVSSFDNLYMSLLALEDQTDTLVSLLVLRDIEEWSKESFDAFEKSVIDPALLSSLVVILRIDKPELLVRMHDDVLIVLKVLLRLFERGDPRNLPLLFSTFEDTLTSLASLECFSHSTSLSTSLSLLRHYIHSYHLMRSDFAAFMLEFQNASRFTSSAVSTLLSNKQGVETTEREFPRIDRQKWMLRYKEYTDFFLEEGRMHSLNGFLRVVFVVLTFNDFSLLHFIQASLFDVICFLVQVVAMLLEGVALEGELGSTIRTFVDPTRVHFLFRTFDLLLSITAVKLRVKDGFEGSGKEFEHVDLLGAIVSTGTLVFKVFPETCVALAERHVFEGVLTDGPIKKTESDGETVVAFESVFDRSQLLSECTSTFLNILSLLRDWSRFPGSYDTLLLELFFSLHGQQSSQPLILILISILLKGAFRSSTREKFRRTIHNVLFDKVRTMKRSKLVTLQRWGAVRADSLLDEFVVQVGCSSVWESIAGVVDACVDRLVTRTYHLLISAVSQWNDLGFGTCVVTPCLRELKKTITKGDTVGPLVLRMMVSCATKLQQMATTGVLKCIIMESNPLSDIVAMVESLKSVPSSSLALQARLSLFHLLDVLVDFSVGFFDCSDRVVEGVVNERLTTEQLETVLSCVSSGIKHSLNEKTVRIDGCVRAQLSILKKIVSDERGARMAIAGSVSEEGPKCRKPLLSLKHPVCWLRRVNEKPLIHADLEVINDLLRIVGYLAVRGGDRVSQMTKVLEIDMDDFVTLLKSLYVNVLGNRESIGNIRSIRRLCVLMEVLSRAAENTLPLDSKNLLYSICSAGEGDHLDIKTRLTKYLRLYFRYEKPLSEMRSNPAFLPRLFTTLREVLNSKFKRESHPVNFTSLTPALYFDRLQGVEVTPYTFVLGVSTYTLAYYQQRSLDLTYNVTKARHEMLLGLVTPLGVRLEQPVLLKISDMCRRLVKKEAEVPALPIGFVPPLPRVPPYSLLVAGYSAEYYKYLAVLQHSIEEHIIPKLVASDVIGGGDVKTESVVGKTERLKNLLKNKVKSQITQ